MTDTVKIPIRVFTSYELLHEYYGDSNLMELGMYEDNDRLKVGHAPNAYSFNPQYFTGDLNYVPNYVPDSPFDPVPPTVPPTEPPTEPPTPTPTPDNISLMYVRPRYSYFEDEETGQAYYSNYVDNLWSGVQDPQDPTVQYTPGRMYLRMEDAPGQVLLKSTLEYGTEDGDHAIGVHEYFDIDATNNEITVTTYLLGEEDSHQLPSSTYTVSEYNAAFYATDEEIDFGCGSPTFPIQQEFNQDEIESYLTTEMGATSFGNAVVTNVDLREVENTNVIIPTAVLDSENELLYDEATSNILAVIMTKVSPNLTAPDYAEGIFSDSDCAGIIDTEQQIDSTNHPNNALDRFAELDYIDYKVLSGKKVTLWDVTGDSWSLLMHSTTESEEMPMPTHYIAINLPIMDANGEGTVIDNVLIELKTNRFPNDEVPAVEWTITSTAQTPSFNTITEPFATVSDYLTEYNYTDVLTINGAEFIEVDLNNIFSIIETAGNWQSEQLNIDDADIRYSNSFSTFVRVHNTDDQGKYYKKEYNLTEAAVTGEDGVWDRWFSSNQEILNFNETCDIIYNGGIYTNVIIEAKPHYTVANENNEE